MARSAAELRRFTHRILRFAVEELGVRTLVLEERRSPDRTHSTGMSALVPEFAGRAAQLLRAPWQSAEVLNLIAWLDRGNMRHAEDPVRVVGAISEDELGLAGHVLEWLRRTQPHRLLGRCCPRRSHQRTTRPTRQGRHRDRVMVLGCGRRSEAATSRLAASAITRRRRTVAATTESLRRGAARRRRLTGLVSDLRKPVGDAARRWPKRPLRPASSGRRYDPQRNADFCMSGTPFGEWFDAIVYVREITPARPLR